MLSSRLLIVITLVIMGMTLGCSQSELPMNHMVTPGVTGNDNLLPVGVEVWGEDGSVLAGTGALGLFSISIDMVNMSVNMDSIRSVSLTDVLEVVDITNFLELAPCTDCAKIKSLAVDSDGHAVLTIGIKHPFDIGDPLKPISGRNRADLHVFNVEGIIISDSTGMSFPGLGETVSGLRLVNADSYTGYLDNSLDEIFPTEATVHPYILHFDDYSAGNFDAGNPMGFLNVTEPPPSGNLVMAMGCDYNFQDYVFDLERSTPVRHYFIFAIGCTYAVSAASKNDRFTPEYRVPQHNKKAASEINVEIISNELKGGIASSTADIEIHVVDISHGVAVGEALNQMKSDSSVDNILIDIPGVMSSPIMIDGGSAISGTGHSPSDPLIYEATVQNSAGGVEGDYVGLVKVLDTYAPGQNGSPLLAGKDGIKRVSPTVNPLDGLFTINEFATYQAFDISVGQACGPITGSILSPSCPVSGVSNNGTLNFTVTASSANGGDPIVLYEVDFDYDGVTFTADGSSTDGVFSSVGPFVVPDPCDDNIPFDFTVAFRATDSCPTPNTAIFATCEVTVDSCIRWKNIPLRPGAVPRDLAVTPEGDLLILYDDAEVWKYFEISYFSHTAAQSLFTAQTVPWPSQSPVLCDDRIDVSDVGNIVAANSEGGLWPIQNFDATGSPLGSAPSPGGGECPDVFTFKNGSGGYFLDHVGLAPYPLGSLYDSMYRASHFGWWWAQNYNDWTGAGPDVHGLGSDHIIMNYVVGCEAESVDTFWAP